MSLIGEEMKSLIDKYKTQGIILALFVLLGCVSGIRGKELFPLHARPVLSKPMVQPEKAFITCGKELSLVVEETQANSWSLRNPNVIQKELKRFMVLRYQESLNDKTWQRYLTRKLKHGPSSI